MTELNQNLGQEEFSPPQIALIIAAERLFGDRSIDSVSLREIAVKAGNGNNNAVQYHFESKRGLIDAIFRFRVQQMETPRAEMLAAMERDNQLSDLRRLSEAYCLPLLNLVDETGKHTYASFISQYILRHRPQGITHAIDTMPGAVSLRKLQSLVDQRLNHLPPDIFQLRLAVVYLIFTNMLERSDSDGVSRDHPVLFQKRVNDALSMMEVAFQAAVL